MIAPFNCCKRNKNLFLIVLLFLSQITFAQDFKFDFGTGKAAKGYTKVQSDNYYSNETGYGFLPGKKVKSVERKTKNLLQADYVTSDSSFFFSVNIPEGSYDVKMILGDADGTSQTTVKVECRRLMLENIQTKSGEFVSPDFTVNLRSPQISATEKIALKPRELNYLHWDNQLTFEFCGKEPKICGLEITKNTQAKTIFLAGNSTVVDQAYEPYAAWGQMISRFFKPKSIVIANYAESGESLNSFVAEKRLNKVLSQMKAGDYLFIEFAHNDQKQKDLLPFVGYKALLEKFISETRNRNGIPVLVTSMHRRNFDSTGHIINTLGDFPEAARQTATEQKVALIDLNAMSKILWEALGPEESKKAFVHYPANSFPGQDKEIIDNTHFNNYGAYQLAKCIIEDIKKQDSELASYLLEGLPAYNPSHPDPIKDFYFPISPLVQVAKPDGN